MIRPKPRRLYKDHRINENLENLLKSYTLWAGTASKLNDPYDCDFELTKDFIQEKYLKNILPEEIQNKGITGKELDAAKAIVLDAFDKNLLKQLHQDYIAGIGVCCFSADPLSELMWSHYADSASGVCLEFSFQKNPDLLKRIIAVSYSDKRITVKNEFDRFLALFQKRSAWKYEKEWRMLYDPGTINFQKHDLLSITFGPRANAAQIQQIRQLVAGTNNCLTFYKCDYTETGLQRIKLVSEQTHAHNPTNQ